MIASLFISGLDWLLPASGVLAVSLLLLLWGYRGAPATGGVRAACAFLKLLGLVALAACLLEPLWTSKPAKPSANFFSDGNATAISADNFDNGGLPPIYPVLIGENEPNKDIAISNVKISQTSFEDAPVTIQADVAQSGYSGSSLVAQLIEVGARGNTNAPSPRPSPPERETETTNTASTQGAVAVQTMKASEDG